MQKKKSSRNSKGFNVYSSINGIDMIVFNIEAVCTRVVSGHADGERKGLLCGACGEVSTAQVLLHKHDTQVKQIV